MFKRKKKTQQQIYQSDKDWEDTTNTNNSYEDNYDEDYDYDEYQKELEKIDKPKIKAKDKEYYVKGADLIAEIRKYQDSKKIDAKKRKIPIEQGQGIISDALGEMIIKICTRFSMHPRFYGYTFRDEFVADAVARCITHGVNKINLDLPNCNVFAYFTQIAYNVFRQKIKNQKKYNQTKQRLRQQVYTDFQNEEGLQQTKQNEDEI